MTELIKTLAPGIISIIGVFVGAMLFHHFAQKREEKQRKISRTLDFVDQFYSSNFIEHRASLWKTRRKVLNHQVSITYIAKGYVYPIESSCYEGDKVYSLTEHEHITLYLSFLKRLGIAIQEGQVDIKIIKDSLSYETMWNADFIDSMVEGVEDLVNSSDKYLLPSFVSSVKTVFSTLDLAKEKYEVSYSEYGEQLKHEK